MDVINENQKRNCTEVDVKKSKSRKLDSSVNDDEKNAMIEKFLNVEKAVVEYAEKIKNYPRIVKNYCDYYQNLDRLNKVQFKCVEKELSASVIQTQENNNILTYLKHIKKTAQELENFL